MQNKSVDSIDTVPGRHDRPEKSPQPEWHDDIPEALRAEPSVPVSAAPPAKVRSRLRLPILWAAVVLSASALGVIVWQQMNWQRMNWQQMRSPIANETIDRSAAPAVTGLSDSTDLAATPTPSPTPLPTLLGHFPYAQAPASSLAAIVSDGSIKLRQPAATRFVEMVKAANAQGVALRPISGFRSLTEQEHIFFDVKAERGQQVQQRAVVSAPPGYSEHHTGYAIDIGDGANPATDLQESFQNTAAFQWLVKNAPRYGFEMSFPRGNPQGVSYEPWHWRFVGDRTSLETFYRARSQSRSQP